MSLTELLVAMAISAVLLVAVVSASLFLQRYLSGWEKQDLLAEELAFVAGEFSRGLGRASDVTVFPDSVCLLVQGRVVVYTWNTGKVARGGHVLTRSSVTIDSLFVHEFSLPAGQADGMFLHGERRLGLYELLVIVSTKDSTVDSLRTVLRNSYGYIKYSP